MTKGKLVRYNGGTESYTYCSSPNVLTKGKVYEVVDEKVYNFHTNYLLNGVIGEFNSVWFDTANPIPKTTHFALASTVPTVGTCMEHFVRFNTTTQEWERYLHSSLIEEIDLIGDVYVVHTKNSIYLTKIIL